MKHKWLVENFDYAKNLIDDNKLPNCLIITGNKSIGKKDLAKEISKYYLGSSSDYDIANKVNSSNTLICGLTQLPY